MDRRVFLSAALALAGCATAPRSVMLGEPLAELEPLYRAVAGRDRLTISVGSNGCTSKDDFAFYLERRAGAVTLAFGRKRLDACRSFAGDRTELEFTWAELGVPPQTPVILLNPLIGRPGPRS